MPSSGDTLRYSVAVDDSTILGEAVKTGPNQTWDFSFLEPESQTLDEYVSSLFTPYAFFFLGFNKYGVKVADSLGAGALQFTDVYSFFRKSNSEFAAEGIGLTTGGLPLPAFYTDDDEIYQFPLDYLDRDSSTFRFEISLPTLGSYSSTGHRINWVNGWGTITTPFGTFNALQVISNINAMDSLSFGAGGFGFPNNTVEIKWLAKGIEIPVLTVVLDGTGAIVTEVRYRDQWRSIDFSALRPNPSFFADLLTPTTIDTVSFFNLTPGFGNSFQWEISPVTHQYINGTTASSRNPEVKFAASGYYDVKLTGTNQYGSRDTTYNQYIFVGVVNSNQLGFGQDLKVFPTIGSQKELTLRFNLKNSEQIRVQVLDQLGRQLNDEIETLLNPGSNHLKIPVNNLPTGLYYLNVIGEDRSQVLKFVRK